VSLLLPQTRTGTVRDARGVDIHGDRYVDVVIALDEPGAAPLVGRVSATECPANLAPGERVAARVTLGVITRIARE
jgi:hypothetical protein